MTSRLPYGRQPRLTSSPRFFQSRQCAPQTSDEAAGQTVMHCHISSYSASGWLYLCTSSFAPESLVRVGCQISVFQCRACVNVTVGA